jgi:glycosyltransferase involved in cell wall biosynthesis
VTDFSLVLIDRGGTAFFASAEREALRGLGQVANTVYVRRPIPGHEHEHDPGEISMGPLATRLEMIRAGVERAACPHVAILDVSELSSFAGAAGLALELLAEDVDFVAAQVIDREGSVLFREGALALDGSPRFATSRDLASEVRVQRPTLLCDPRAFAASRDMLLASWRRGTMPADAAASAELAWRCWLAGGRAVASRGITVIADEPLLPASAGPWKASLGRLLQPETLARTPEGSAGETSVEPARIATRLFRASDLPAPAVMAALELRTEIQKARTLADRELVWEGLLADTWDVDGESPRRRRVAFLCSDAVGTSMAGPAIRSVELARVLAEHADVRLASRLGDGLPLDLPCPLHELTDETVGELLAWADAVVIQGPLTDWHREVLRSELPIAVDLYDPMHLEALESVDPDLLVPYTTNLLHDQLWRGDYFFCASERQRDFWLGMLAASGRVTPGRYEEDADLDGLIGVVPYGIADEAPPRTGAGIRAALAGVGPDDPLFVWNGGIWQWFDPDLLVLAIERLRDELPDVRALFMGVRRPGSELTDEARRLIGLIDERGLRDVNVFVRDWTPYAERADTYLDATAVVSLHHAHIETRFSFRTRLLDAIWSATPIICTAGDVLAPIVRDEQIGIAVPAGDLDAIVDALRALATDHDGVAEMRARLRALAPQYHWQVAAAPLVEWCASAPARRKERFAVTGLDPELADLPAVAVPSLGLKALIPRPLRQHVLGPLKRRILESR